MSFWDSLSTPWQAALELAWEACCADTVPIGAVVVDAQGNILARGRNRIHDQNPPAGQIANDTLAHAEINAMLALDADQDLRHACTLYTTMEPCPLCMGAIYMSAVRRVCYAARDPYAGSTDLLGKTWYLSWKPVRASGPFDADLEDLLIAIHTERDILRYGGDPRYNNLLRRWRRVVPRGVAFGAVLAEDGSLEALRRAAPPARQAFETLIARLPSPADPSHPRI
jgi:tRNA(adenine34) deaminase